MSDHQNSKETLLVNFFAGPGAGKTTCAWEVAAELKKTGVVAEYVPEYAKELVWDDNLALLDGSFASQTALFREQKRRIDRLIGKVDVIVTDSPLLLQVAYIKEQKAEFEALAASAHDEYNNFNLFINRGKSFEKEGRIHDLKASQAVDASVKDILHRNEAYFGNYYHQTVPVVGQNILTTLLRLQSRGKSPMQRLQQAQNLQGRRDSAAKSGASHRKIQGEER